MGQIKKMVQATALLKVEVPTIFLNRAAGEGRLKMGNNTCTTIIVKEIALSANNIHCI